MSSAVPPLLIGFVEGQIDLPMLEGGVGFYDCDEKYMHTRVLTWQALHDILTTKNGAEGVCSEQAKEHNVPIESLLRLTREKLHLHLLVNSGGGSVQVASALKKIMAAIHDASGRTISYGTEYVCSAAADIFGSAQRRYALRNSTFLFHGTSHKLLGASMEHRLDKNTRETLRMQRAQEMAQYKKMLLAQIKGKNRKRVQWAFDIAMNNSENRLLDTYFRGEDLKGFVKSAFINRRGLWNAFIRETGFHPDFANDLFSNIRPFFIRSQKSKKAKRHSEDR